MGKRWLGTLGVLVAVSACSQSGVPLPTLDLPSPTAGPARIEVAAVSPSPSPVPTATATPTAVPKLYWLAFGDSITQDAFNAAPTAWAAGWGLRAPTIVNAGIRGADSAYALTQADEILGNNGSATLVGLAFGTNDAGHTRTPEAFHGSLLALIARVRAAGKRPLLARIPYSSAKGYEAIPQLNTVIQQVETDEQLPAGPDLYAWFAMHPEQIGPDGIHMTTEGDEAIQRLWAEAAVKAGF